MGRRFDLAQKLSFLDGNSLVPKIYSWMGTNFRYHQRIYYGPERRPGFGGQMLLSQRPSSLFRSKKELRKQEW